VVAVAVVGAAAVVAAVAVAVGAVVVVGVDAPAFSFGRLCPYPPGAWPARRAWQGPR